MNFAVLADLNATRANCEAFRLALKKLDGSVSYCKFYSYNPKRDHDYGGYIRSSGADVAVPLYNRKKARIDMRQVIDAVSVCCTNSAIDAFFIICAPLDCTPLLAFLKGAGKYVVLGGDGEPSYTSGFDDFLRLERSAEAEKGAKSAKPEKTAPVSVKRESAPPKESGDEFLPHTGISGGGEAMKEVKARLSELMREKSAAAPAPEEETLPPEEELQRLFKKYF